MKREDADKIFEDHCTYKDVSCSCHNNPPCDKCVNQSSEELINEALLVMSFFELEQELEDLKTANKDTSYDREALVHLKAAIACIESKPIPGV